MDDKDVRQYGDLSEHELYEFLHEIESSDDAMQEIQNEAANRIDTEEAQAEISEETTPEIVNAPSILTETPENAAIEAEYGDDAWRQPHVWQVTRTPSKQRAANASKKTTQVKLNGLKEDRLRIQRNAFEQKDIDLSSEIGNINIKLLLELLVRDHTRLIDKYTTYINTRISALISVYIPRKLRLCMKEYPGSIKRSEGFLYKASKDYGDGKLFWVNLDNVPYYFTQGTETVVLRKYYADSLLVPVDRAIISYHVHNEKRAEKEVKYASMIIRKKVRTYFDLLRFNPFWFELLYTHLTKDKK